MSNLHAPLRGALTYVFFITLVMNQMLTRIANISTFTATLIGAAIGGLAAALMYVTLPPVRALYHWQWNFMTAHPSTLVACAAVGIAIGYYSDRD